MEFLKDINTNAKSNETTGFGTNSNRYGGRFVNKDGSANVERRGMAFFQRVSWYHTMLEMNRWKFLSIIIGFYIVVNLFFAEIYCLIGLEYLTGIDSDGTKLEQFWNAYFFASQTFTTVGYGHISPNGFLTSTIAAFQALVGLLSFAIATGLFFGRFSKPTAYIKFSENAIIAPYKNGKALMIRMSPFKNTNYTDATVRVTLAMRLNEGGELINKFYQLQLEMNFIDSLNLSWTIVHDITENSPLYGFLEQDFQNTQGELLVFLKTYDDMFSTVVSAKTSYTFDEFKYGEKFEVMYAENAAKTKTILQVDKLNATYKVDIQ